VKQRDKTLRWVFLAAATGEAGRHAVRMLIRLTIRLFR
jgi:hypothetical protein